MAASSKAWLDLEGPQLKARPPARLTQAWPQQVLERVQGPRLYSARASSRPDGGQAAPRTRPLPSKAVRVSRKAEIPDAGTWAGVHALVFLPASPAHPGTPTPPRLPSSKPHCAVKGFWRLLSPSCHPWPQRSQASSPVCPLLLCVPGLNWLARWPWGPVLHPGLLKAPPPQAILAIPMRNGNEPRTSNLLVFKLWSSVATGKRCEWCLCSGPGAGAPQAHWPGRGRKGRECHAPFPMEQAGCARADRVRHLPLGFPILEGRGLPEAPPSARAGVMGSGFTSWKRGSKHSSLPCSTPAPSWGHEAGHCRIQNSIPGSETTYAYSATSTLGPGAG